MTPFDALWIIWLALFTGGYLYGDYTTCDGGTFDAAQCEYYYGPE